MIKEGNHSFGHPVPPTGTGLADIEGIVWVSIDPLDALQWDNMSCLVDHSECQVMRQEASIVGCLSIWLSWLRAPNFPVWSPRKIATLIAIRDSPHRPRCRNSKDRRSHATPFRFHIPTAVHHMLVHGIFAKDKKLACEWLCRSRHCRNSSLSQMTWVKYE